MEAIGYKRIYLILGTRTVVLANGKSFKLLPGMCFGITDNQFHNYNIKSLVDSNIQSFPQLSNPAIQDEINKQAAILKKEVIKHGS